jgi:phosphoribosyl-ATP pyrophosphohydrolase
MKTFAAALLFGATIAVKISEDGTEVPAVGDNDEMRVVHEVAEALYHCTDKDGDGALSLGEMDEVFRSSNKTVGKAL